MVNLFCPEDRYPINSTLSVEAGGVGVQVCQVVDSLAYRPTAARRQFPSRSPPRNGTQSRTAGTLLQVGDVVTEPVLLPLQLPKALGNLIHCFRVHAVHPFLVVERDVHGLIGDVAFDAAHAVAVVQRHAVNHLFR